MLTPTPKLDNPLTMRRAIQQLGNLLDQTKSPKFNSITLLGVTANRLVQTDADKKLASVGNLANWIEGTENQITVTDNGNGTLTLSLDTEITEGTLKLLDAGNSDISVDTLIYDAESSVLL